LFLAPLVVAIVIVTKALEIANQILGPVASWIPAKSLIGLKTPIFLALVLVLVFCFLAGLFAQTVLAGKIVSALEDKFLSNIPGYEFMKNVAQGILGVDPEHGYKPVLAHFEDSWQIAFLIERMADNRVTVFVPSAPHGMSGLVYILKADQITPINLPAPAVLKSLGRLGVGSGAILGGSGKSPNMTSGQPKTTEEKSGQV